MISGDQVEIQRCERFCYKTVESKESEEIQENRCQDQNLGIQNIKENKLRNNTEGRNREKGKVKVNKAEIFMVSPFIEPILLKNINGE